MPQDENLAAVVSTAAQDIGGFIRSQRELAQVSVRQLAEKAGVRIGSINPNLFQDQAYKFGSATSPNDQARKRTTVLLNGIKAWLYGSGMSLALGLTLAVTGARGLLFSDTQFNYESPGVSLPGEPSDFFDNYLGYRSHSTAYCHPCIAHCGTHD